MRNAHFTKYTLFLALRLFQAIDNIKAKYYELKIKERIAQNRLN